MKKFLVLFLVASFNISAADEGITQWAYNTLQRAQAYIDNGNIEAAVEKYTTTGLLWISHPGHMIIVILRTYSYFLLTYERNKEALRYLKQASL